jgi:hypothetical protein
MMPNNDAGTAWATFAWVGTNNPSIKETIFAGNAVPSRMSFRPPPDTNASWWWNISSYSSPLGMFIIDQSTITTACPLFMDLEFEYILSNGTSTALTVTATSFTGIVANDLPINTQTWLPLELALEH